MLSLGYSVPPLQRAQRAIGCSDRKAQACNYARSAAMMPSGCSSSFWLPTLLWDKGSRLDTVTIPLVDA